MTRYIAFLRGINVGGHKKILMADLKLLFESLGFEKVATYIQSGNVVFGTENEINLAAKITNAIEVKYGYKVSVLVKKASELDKILLKSPFFDEKLKKSYFILLEEKPSLEHIALTTTFSNSNEEFYITENCVYIYYAQGAGKAKLGNNFFEKKLNVSATARNYNTIVKLIELSA
ncbi:MAG TPA: DUF1697 domain-containing protein [Flavobacteriaceae bacterium]|nr:hypothetical protein [Flavobacteriaceae bacterium]HAT67764.1 DUF1697 domain-containing protein [Flavobacteriaceae bacterium]|tara:strand:- start:266213 stop:266737 length:525 start_codon:yes stop_codon:yes gene_type:complete